MIGEVRLRLDPRAGDLGRARASRGRSRGASRCPSRARDRAATTTSRAGLVGVELPHHVDPALREERIEPRALLGEEARVLDVLLRPREVERSVSDVEVATDRDRTFLGDEALRERQEVLQVLALDREALLGGRARRDVEADDREPVEIAADRAALVLAVVEARAARVAVRRFARVERDARVALLVRAEPARVVAGRRSQRAVDVRRCRAQLLETQEVRLALLQPARKPLAPRTGCRSGSACRSSARGGTGYRTSNAALPFRREARPSSSTSTLVAFFRALGDAGFTSVREFSDPTAKPLLPRSGRSVSIRSCAGSRALAAAKAWSRSRRDGPAHLVLDEEVRKAIAEGARQLVILGRASTVARSACPSSSASTCSRWTIRTRRP